MACKEVGKVLAPPWGSVYMSEERLVFQKETLEVRNWYREFGLAAENLYREPDDHIALELGFLAHLAKLEYEALKAKDVIRYQEIRQAQL